ncbi:MAG: Ig-like domain-containing protein [Verrucomicrobiales bacterium]|nr:Ig-like domain-containing protein [Verrucomicrobiales bacterium]
MHLQSAEAPRLSVTRTEDSRVRLAWSVAGGVEFRLEGSANLTQWVSVPNTPTLDGPNRSVTVSSDDAPRFYRLRGGATLPPFVLSTSPVPGEQGVAVTREVVVRLSARLAANVVPAANMVFADASGRRILSRIEFADTRDTLTLFFLENLPAGSRIQITVDGDRLPTLEGPNIDVDGDGQPGGMGVFTYETASTLAFDNTSVIGRVFASEKLPNGSNLPLSGVTITVDGAEETLRAVTDAEGFFRLSPSPTGRFFVHVDGRTAAGSSWPSGNYYPFVGKAWEAVVGRTNLASGSGEIFLPLVPAESLTPVRADEPTTVRFAPAIIAANPALAGVEIVVPPNSLFSDSGARGGRVGIAAVPPDRLPEPLPNGLNFPVVITIQTDGAMNFAQPVPVRFPNLPDPTTGVKLPPGAKTVLWSFNHDTGRWEAQGTATISADGNFAVTDPGVGVRQPGWHAVAAGSRGSGPRPPWGPGRKGWPDNPETSQEPPCTGDDCDCTQTIICRTETPGKFSALCALDCLGNVVDDMFGDGPRMERTAFEVGLQCIGGPETCPGRPEAVLNQKRRSCMNECTHPLVQYMAYTMPCEGFLDPCGGPALHSLHGHAAGLPANAEFADLIPDRLEEQYRLWDLEADFFVKLCGTPKITAIESADAAKLYAFLDAFREHVQPGTPAGIRLSAGERAALIALPRPAPFTAPDWAALIDRLDSIQGNVPAEVKAADDRLQALVGELKRRGWKSRTDGLVQGLSRLSRYLAPEPGSELFPIRAHHYYMKDHVSGQVWRGRLSRKAKFEGVVLSPDGFYTVAYMDPVTLRTGVAFFAGAFVGQETQIPTAPLEPSSAGSPDTDADGLPNVSELILGTNDSNPDTDGDGIADGDEVSAGSNPLDGIPAATGLVAAMSLPGATDVAVSGNHAYIASLGGVVIAELRGAENPVAVTTIPLAGQAGVVVAASENVVAAAATGGGVFLLNISNPEAPVTLWSGTLGSPATALAIYAGGVYAGTSDGRVMVLQSDGQVLQQFELGRGVVKAMVFGGGRMVVTTVSHLVVFDRNEDGWQLAGEVQLTGNFYRELGGGLVLENGVAWAAFNGGGRSGLVSVDVSNPRSPAVIARAENPQPLVNDMASVGNGSVLAVNRNNVLKLSQFDLRQPANPTNFVRALPGSANVQAVVIHRGLAIAASGGSGLEVFNFLPPDFARVPPTVALSATYSSIVPRRAEFGGRLPVQISARDDVGIRSIELLMDGAVVFADGKPGGSTLVTLPPKAAGRTSVTLRARATDIGGNTAESADETVQLVDDATPPSPRVLLPAGGGLIAPDSWEEVSVTMNEPILTPVTAATLTLRNTVTGTDVPGTISYDPAGPTLKLVTAPLPAGKYAATLAGGLRDAAGNESRPVTWSFETTAPAVKAWFPGNGESVVDLGRTLPFIRVTFTTAIMPKTFLGQTWQVQRWDLDPTRSFTGPPVETVAVEAIQNENKEAVLLRTPGGFATGLYKVSITGGFLNGVQSGFAFRNVPNEWVVLDNGNAGWRYGLEYPAPDRTDALIINAPGRDGPEIITRGGWAYIDARSHLRIGGGPAPVFDVPGGMTSSGLLQIFGTRLQVGGIRATGPVEILNGGMVLDGGFLETFGGGRLTHGVGVERGYWLNHPGSTFVFSHATFTSTSSGTNGIVINRGTFDVVQSVATTSGSRIRNDGELRVREGTMTIRHFDNRGSVQVDSGAKLHIQSRIHHDDAARLTGDGGLELVGPARTEPVADIRGDYALTGPLILQQAEATFWKPVTLPGEVVLNSSRLRLLSPSTLGSVSGGSGVIHVNTAAEILSVSNFLSVESLGTATIRRGIALRSIEASGTGRVEFTGDTVMTNGTQPVAIGVADAVVRNSGQWTVSSGGVNGWAIWNRRGATSPGVGRFENAGFMEFTTDRPADIHHRFINSGELRLRKGPFIVQRQDSGGGGGAYGVLTQTESGVMILADTEIQHANGGNLDLGPGTVRGTGVIRARNTSTRPKVTHGGVLQPGNPVGRITIDATGGFEQTATGELRILLSSAGFGILQVQTGDALLAGRLRVELLDGFVPPIDPRVYDVLRYNRRTGEFSEVILPSLPPGRKWQLEYGDFAVNLRVVPE